MKAVINEKGILLDKTALKYIDIINSGSITESQIISLRSYLHKCDKEVRRAIFDVWHELEISPEQNKKGYEFLMKQWKTGTGKEAKNNPFGYREQNILENFDRFTYCENYDSSRYGQNPFYLPVYRCYSKNGNSFEYYYNGKVNIIG